MHANSWVGGFNPSEKYESQLGWLFPIYGKKCSKPLTGQGICPKTSRKPNKITLCEKTIPSPGLHQIWLLIQKERRVGWSRSFHPQKIAAVMCNMEIDIIYIYIKNYEKIRSSHLITSKYIYISHLINIYHLKIDHLKIAAFEPHFPS